jgi:uncharacterized protein (DUF302 family)
VLRAGNERAAALADDILSAVRRLMHTSYWPGQRCQTIPAMESVTKLSSRSVPETVTRITETLAAKGVKLFAVIDHSGEAAAAGLELRDTKVVIFGSPLAGTPVMQAAPLAALDLPLKILVWADGDQTKVTYAPPSELAARYDLTDELAGRLAAVNAITDAVTAG